MELLTSEPSAPGAGIPEPEHALDHRDLGGCGVGAAERRPVVGGDAGGDDVAAPVDGAGDQGHLQQR